MSKSNVTLEKIKTTRETITKDILNMIDSVNYTGTIVLNTGTGKSKVAIDILKQGNFTNVLITSPRTNLKNNWKKELEKWGIFSNTLFKNEYFYKLYDKFCKTLSINVENIQTCYKWDKEKLKNFTFVIVDEVHTIGEEYFALIRNCRSLNIPVIGLTATPNKEDVFKTEVLYKILPIIYEYTNSEQDAITNKVKYWVYKYNLSDNFKVYTGNGTKKWLVGEKTHYEYLCNVIKTNSDKIKNYYFLCISNGVKNRIKLNNILATGKLTEEEISFLEQAISKDLEYFYFMTTPKYENKSLSIVLYYALKEAKGTNFSILGTNCLRFLKLNLPPDIKTALIKYNWAINKRKTFLWSLESSKQIALEFKKRILAPKLEGDYEYGIFWNENKNKVLLFSELTEKANSLSEFVVHSNSANTVKEVKRLNEEVIEKFNNDIIKEIASVNSLTLGMNLTNPNWAIFESFNGSKTSMKQKSGRTNRLDVNKVANIIIIVPSNTQAETWFEKAFGSIEEENITIVESIEDIIY